MRQRHHHLFLRNQVFVTEIGMILDDLGAARVAEGIANLDQFTANDVEQQFRVCQDIR